MQNNPLKPPFDAEAERNVISSVLIDRDALIKSAEILDSEDFYEPAHKLIFAACKSLFEQSSAVDIVTVKAYLSKSKDLDKVGGAKILTELVSILPLTTNVEHYSKIIKEASLRRKIISLSSDFVGFGLDETKKIDEIVDQIEKRIFSIAQKSINKGFVVIKDVINELNNRLLDTESNADKMRGYTSGFGGMDTIIGGFHPGELIILAARPSVGKTAFMLEIARHFGIVLRKKIAIFSLEMGKDQLGERMISLQGELDLFDIRQGNLDGNKYSVFSEASSDLYEADIYIDDTPGQHISEVRSKCRKMDLEINGLDAIFVDYLQLLYGSNTENRALEVAEISKSLKNIARELEVPVFALSQLSRAVESRTDKRPQLSDLRESGSIEQDADMVIFLHREAMFNRDISDEDRDKAEAIIAKNRQGATGTAYLRFEGRLAKYRDEPDPESRRRSE